MQRLVWLSIVLGLLSGCAGNQATRATTAASGSVDDPGQLGLLKHDQEEQQKRILELESRLALLETEARRQRDGDRPANATIRIGAQKSAPRRDISGDTSDAPELADANDGLRSDNDRTPDAVIPVATAPRGKNEHVPTLRLYGTGTSAANDGALDVPQGAPALLVAPLPEERAKSLGSESAEDAKQQYKAALRLLRAQRYDDALSAFDAFITSHPTEALVGNALYWRAEAHYAKREYQLARAAFESLLARFGESDKAPDSLLKVGLCLRRLGDEAQAKVYFRRVLEKFPNTQAAQLASKEGST